VNLGRMLGTTTLGLALTGVMLAQQPAGPGPGMGRGRVGAVGRGMFGAMGARQDVLFGYLGLTDAQRVQAQTIFNNAKTAAQPIRDQLKQARADLHAAIGAGKPVNDLAAVQGSLMGQLIAIRANAQEQFRGILTPDQLTKLQQLRNKRPQPSSPPPSNG